MTSSRYYNEYYLPQKPVMVQLCADGGGDCDFSAILDNSSNAFSLYETARTVLSGRQWMQWRFQEKVTNMASRASLTVIEEVDPRISSKYESLYKAFRRPLFLEDVDIYNDLLGYLRSSDEHGLLSNDWIIFGVKSGGATFHADFYGVSFTNALIEGSKYWVLMSPEDTLSVWNHSIDALLDIQSMANWEWFDRFYLNGFLDEEYERIHGESTYYHCLQEPGDLLIGPELFYHITVNVEQSMGIGQALVTKERFNDYTFSFFGSYQEDPHKLLDHDSSYLEKYSLSNGMRLCVALYHYDSVLWRGSVCNDPLYVELLKGTKYQQALEHALSHHQFTDFL